MKDKIITDVSLHFTIKNQTTQSLCEKLEMYIEEALKFFCIENTLKVHHCFPHKEECERMGLDANMYLEVLNTLSDYPIFWSNTSDHTLEWDRRLMLENLKKLDGVAIFLGKIENGVEIEYKIAKELDVSCIHIP